MLATTMFFTTDRLLCILNSVSMQVKVYINRKIDGKFVCECDCFLESSKKSLEDKVEKRAIFLLLLHQSIIHLLRNSISWLRKILQKIQNNPFPCLVK